MDHAEKITPAHRYVDFGTATADNILTHHQVLGDLWSHLHNGERIVFNEISPLCRDENSDRKPGLFVLHEVDGSLVARTRDCHLLDIRSSTLPGGRKGMGNAHVKRLLECRGA